MVMKPHQKLWMGAVGTLLVGGIAAASIFQTPTDSGSANTGTLRELAARVGSESIPPLNPGVPPVVREEPPAPKPAVRVRRTVSAPPPAKPVETPETRAAQARAASEELVKNIALMGITNQGNDLQVWLVDLSNNERSVVSEGEDAFGFTVRDIADEHVLLARGPDQFSVWLGEKQIPVSSAEEGATGGGFGPGGFGPGGFGPGGFGGGDRRAMFMNAMAAMASNRSGGGGGWNGNRGGWGGGGGSWGGGNFNRSRSGGWGNGGFRPTFSAGARPGGFGGGFGGGGNWGGNQGNRNSNVQLSTSNPQTARRRGSRLVGGSDPIPTPDAVSNPQTMRRRGTSSGQAFGDNSSSSRNGQRTSSNRSSGR